MRPPGLEKENMSYLYETHLHTSQISNCGRSRGAEYISIYKDLGYTGIFVTDHFYRGNCAVDRNLPWREWVNRFCQGYEDARNEGERRGLDVFFGWEETFDNNDDYLIYGLDKNWLFEHPEARNWTRGEQYRTVKHYGGCVIQAHPFRQHDYITKITLSTGCVDGVEAANGGNFEQSYDALAMQYGKSLGLPVTAGSDIHTIKQAREGSVFGVYLKDKIEPHSNAYVIAIREKNTVGLKMPPGRCDFKGDEKVLLPVDVRDEYDKNTGKNWREVLKLK